MMFSQWELTSFSAVQRGAFSQYINIYHLPWFLSKVGGAGQSGVFNSTLTRDIALPVNATIDQLDQIPLSDVQGFKEVALPWYTDQVLPFDITLAAANEYGAAASCKIFGVEILNEGFGSSIDDSMLERQYVYRNIGFSVEYLVPPVGQERFRVACLPHRNLMHMVGTTAVSDRTKMSSSGNEKPVQIVNAGTLCPQRSCQLRTGMLRFVFVALRRAL